MRAAILIAAALSACAPTTELSNNASRAAERDRVGRDSYSPHVARDRYVLDQQHTLAESLRRACAQTGEHCALADNAERYLDAQDARR